MTELQWPGHASAGQVAAIGARRLRPQVVDGAPPETENGAGLQNRPCSLPSFRRSPLAGAPSSTCTPRIIGHGAIRIAAAMAASPPEQRN
jgi:hypothetical protein